MMQKFGITLITAIANDKATNAGDFTSTPQIAAVVQAAIIARGEKPCLVVCVRENNRQYITRSVIQYRRCRITQ